MSDALALGLLTVCVAIGVFDLVARRVPNSLLLVGLGLQMASLWMVPTAVAGLTSSAQPALLGFVLGFFVFLPFWRFGVMGAGDVKFLAVLGFALGPAGLFVSWLVASVLAGIHAVGAVIGQRFAQSAAGSPLSMSARPWAQALAPARRWLAVRRGTRQGAPYATYLAIGALSWIFILSRQ